MIPQLPGTVRQRVLVAALSVSAVAFVQLTGEEHYTDNAVIPVKGDVPTYGFGMTHRPDGTPVRMGDRTTPPQALRMSIDHIQKDEKVLKGCITAPLLQGEYDLMVNHAYQYGSPATCHSNIVRLANAGEYEASCRAYLEWKKVGHFDCSTPGNKVCMGVWTRSQNRFKQCMALQPQNNNEKAPA